MDKRIKEIRSSHGLNQEEFAQKIKRKQSTIAGYEIGKKVPEAAILSICKAFPDVNENWLRTGDGQMTLEKNKEDGKQLARLQEMSENKKKLLRLLEEMPEELLDEMLSIIKDSTLK